MTTVADLYLDLLKRCLLGVASAPSAYRPLMPSSRRNSRVLRDIQRMLAPFGLGLARVVTASERRAIEAGLTWPAEADTMIGVARLDNLQDCVETAIRDDIPGDLIETGVWRGGACILMRGILAARGDATRRVWVADSFQGLPPPSMAEDTGDTLYTYDALRVSLEQVRANFRRYGLLDERVCFLKGWFKDTLPLAPIERLAVLRLDGDMYESTMDAIQSLYPKLSPGGFCIVDDYGIIRACKQAITDYRAQFGITEPIQDIDGSGVYWRKAR